MWDKGYIVPQHIFILILMTGWQGGWIINSIIFMFYQTKYRTLKMYATLNILKLYNNILQIRM